jgi:hypothetical protein
VPDRRELPEAPAWERIATFLAIFLLWPKIWAHWTHRPWPLADVLMYAALLLMLVVFIRKAVRISRYWKSRERDEGPR